MNDKVIHRDGWQGEYINFKSKRWMKVKVEKTKLPDRYIDWRDIYADIQESRIDGEGPIHPRTWETVQEGTTVVDVPIAAIEAII